MARNYSSIYNLKDYAATSLAPKYFNMNEVNDLNVGLLGFVTEMISTIAEDGFNTTTTYLNEIFPNKAVLPETIYNDAAMFQEDDIFAKPAEMMAWLFIPENMVLLNGTVVESSGGHKEFFIDSDLTINVGGVQFMLDYDIRLSYISPDNSTVLYTAAYDRRRYSTEYTSSLDADNSYYIKSRVITYNNERYIAMYVKLHQVTRYTLTETVINNDVINAPFFKIPFNGDIASFEVFCKEPDENNYTQLKKKLLGSAPEKDTMFCYYRLSGENELEVTFSMKDGYYKPAFGSEIIIDYTTTLGTNGEFSLYTGSDIICVGKSTQYKYNDNLIIFCITQSPSQFAKDKMSLEDLKIRNVENMASVKSYTTESDLDLYFSRFTSDSNMKMYTIKKRNDYRDRVFSSYALYRNSLNDIIKTNTSNMILKATSTTNSFNLFSSFGDSLKYIPAGTLFTANTNSDINEVIFTSHNIHDYIANPAVLGNAPFVYASPFAIYMTQNPTLIGYYRNNMDVTYPMDYDYINTSSFIQFICMSLNIQRDSISGTLDERSKYHVTLVLSPTSTVNVATVNISENPSEPNNVYVVSMPYGENDYVILGYFNMTTGDIEQVAPDSSFKTLLRFNNDDMSPHIKFNVSHFDSVSRNITLKCDIKTDDYITAHQFRVLGLISDSGESVNRMVDMYDSKVFISTYIRGTITNRYRSMDPNITFIKPLSMCSSDVVFTRAKIIDNTPEASRPTDTDELASFMSLVDTTIYSSPLVSADTLSNKDSRDEFYNKYTKQYDYIEDILDNITNNFNIDLKFYNTYGPSRNFHVENDDSATDVNPLIDSVNIKIHFKIKLVHGADADLLTRDIKYFVKNYVETINMDSSNSIYISNMIKSLENEFSLIKYIKFAGISGIQDYSLQTQAIENSAIDVSNMNYVERRNFVPEYLTIDLNDVNITVL